jgi:serine/threonine-protein kinase
MLQQGQVIEFDTKKYFKYIRKLGHGGTGDTNLFLDETTNIEFAIKKYDPKAGNDKDENYSRFVEEIKILFNLSHPNIVRVYNYYLYPKSKTGYIQMEYIDGVAIDKYEYFFWEKDWNDLFIEAISAFKYLEENKILHRDIRPANILIDKNNSLKIIDFGFGKKLESNETGGKSVLLNWPVSEFPDELKKDGTYNHQTEIYFLGKLFKKLPLEDEFTSFNYKHVIEKMVQSSPNQRYATFAEVMSDVSQGIEFSGDDKRIYGVFADTLLSHISHYRNTFSYENNIITILDKISELLRVSSLETYIQNNSKLISCFITSGYSYIPKKDIETEIVKDFYRLFRNLPEQRQKILLDNLVTRLANIKVEKDEDNLPF